MLYDYPTVGTFCCMKSDLPDSQHRLSRVYIRVPSRVRRKIGSKQKWVENGRGRKPTFFFEKRKKGILKEYWRAIGVRKYQNRHPHNKQAED